MAIKKWLKTLNTCKLLHRAPLTFKTIILHKVELSTRSQAFWPSMFQNITAFHLFKYKNRLVLALPLEILHHPSEQSVAFIFVTKIKSYQLCGNMNHFHSSPLQCILWINTYFEQERILTAWSSRSKLLSCKGCNTKLAVWWDRGPVWSIGPSRLEWRCCCSIGGSNWWLKTNTQSIEKPWQHWLSKQPPLPIHFRPLAWI